MKFEKLQQFIEQKESMEKAFGEMMKREQEALETLHAKKLEYESTIAMSVKEGKDSTSELDKLDEEITLANSSYLRRKKEREIFEQTRPLESIKAEDVVNAFNDEIVPKFKNDQFDAVLKQLLKAKYSYVKAVEDYDQSVKEFESLKKEARAELSDFYKYKLKDVELQTNTEIERYFITNNDLFDLSVKRFPNSLKYVKPEELE